VTAVTTEIVRTKCSKSNGRFNQFLLNGLEALQVEKSKPYDVIICDYDMPI
jgi:CheY-like chemotaxis protein